MMEQFIELLKEVNIAQIFIILAGGWVMYNRLDKKIGHANLAFELRIQFLLFYWIHFLDRFY